MEKFNLRYLKPSAFIFICAVLALSLYAANKYSLTHWGVSFSIFSAIGILFGIINSYLWNKKPFCWLYNVPDFSGRYTGTSKSEYRNDKGEILTGNMEHIKVVVQNGSDIVVNSWAKTKEGTISTSSRSIEASIAKEKDGTYSLIYTYLNEGNFELGFCPYYGTEVLKLIENEDGKHLVGKYYTERMPYQTKGKTDLKFESKKLYHEK